MTEAAETAGGKVFRDPASLDPFEIGKEVTPSPRKLIRWPFSKPQPSLTESEIHDLLTIDTGGMTFDDVSEYARSHVAEYASYGKVRLQSHKARDFREARQVDSWLEEGQYDKVAALFLQKAREAWSSGYLRGGDDKSDYMYCIVGAEAAATVPWSVQVQGDSAIKEFLLKSEGTLTLRMAKTNSATYLRQASVLARLISKITQSTSLSRNS